MEFESFALGPKLIHALADQGITEPTEIQSAAIPILLDGDTDFIGQAQTGTGKTLAFLLPLLSRVDLNSNYIQALVLAPTRELASQIAVEAAKLLPESKNKVEVVYGGQSVGLQLRDLKRNRPAILVGTPGRVKDLLERELLDLSQCQTSILDEADEMLDMGFLDDVKRILSFLSTKKKIWMFSATMPTEIRSLIKDFFNNPKEVKIAKKTLSNADVEQSYYLTRFVDKLEALSRLLDSLDDFFLIIFCKTKIETKELSDELNRRGFQADALHGDMAQDQRDLTMDRFKNRHVHILVCTDVAARGIDVDSITHVINYGLPQDNESYVHRIGRTGRAGNKGQAISLIDSAEHSRIREIESITRAEIKRKYLPEVGLIKSNMIKREAKGFKISLDSWNLENEELFQDDLEIFEQSLAGASKEDLIKAIFVKSMQERLMRYVNGKKLDIEPYRAKPVKPGFKKFFINLGKVDGLELGDLLKIICRNSGASGNDIGKIVFKDNFSFFEASERIADKVSSLNQLDLAGKKIVCEESNQNQKKRRPYKSRGGYRKENRY